MGLRGDIDDLSLWSYARKGNERHVIEMELISESDEATKSERSEAIGLLTHIEGGALADPGTLAAQALTRRVMTRLGAS